MLSAYFAQIAVCLFMFHHAEPLGNQLTLAFNAISGATGSVPYQPQEIPPFWISFSVGGFLWLAAVIFGVWAQKKALPGAGWLFCFSLAVFPVFPWRIVRYTMARDEAQYLFWGLFEAPLGPLAIYCLLRWEHARNGITSGLRTCLVSTFALFAVSCAFIIFGFSSDDQRFVARTRSLVSIPILSILVVGLALHWRKLATRSRELKGPTPMP